MFVSIRFKDGTSRHFASVSTFKLKHLGTNVDNYGAATHIEIVGVIVSNKQDSTPVKTYCSYKLSVISCITSCNEKSSAIILNTQSDLENDNVEI